MGNRSPRASKRPFLPSIQSTEFTAADFIRKKPLIGLPSILPPSSAAACQRWMLASASRWEPGSPVKSLDYLLLRVGVSMPGMLSLRRVTRSEEHTSELQPLMRNSYAVLCLQKKTQYTPQLS